MAEQGKKLIEIVETFAPLHLAESWDNVGLQLGNPDKEVQKVMVCLEVTEAVIEEAIDRNVDMIITHHPLIFKPLKQIVTGNPMGGMIHSLIRKDILLYCAHTNLDIAKGGLNDIFAHSIGLVNIKALEITHEEKCFKVVVFVPQSHLEDVRKALCEAGAGYIGNYKDCTFQSVGEGTFTPLEDTNPYIGIRGKLEVVKECRLETILPESKLRRALKKMIEAHPYEEAAYDIYPLANTYDKMGMGRMGELKEPERLTELCCRLKEMLGLEKIKIISNSDKYVQKIGLCTGSGSEFIHTAYLAGCDCFITGDIKYHEGQYALQMNMPLIDGGHFNIENYTCDLFTRVLVKHFKDNQCNVDVFFANTNIDPFHFI